jgi:aspartate oxidase
VPPPEFTAPTGWLRIRCSNAWSSAAALPWLRDEPIAPDGVQVPGRLPQSTLPAARVASEELRRQVWRDAGVIRDPAGLADLARSPDPLASLVARFALARTESRGVHYRTDAPVPDPALEGHFVLTCGGELKLEHWT